jgi:acetoin utilization protein AcuB
VRPEEALTGAVIRMTREQIRHMPVVDAEDRVIGIVSDRDLRVVLGDPTRVAERGESEQDDDLTVAWAMTGNPVCVRPDESLFELASYFLDERVGAVLVTDDNGVLLGIASYLDLLEYLMGRSAPSRAD